MVTLHANYLTAEARCACGLIVRVERDECGAIASTFACSRVGCAAVLCDHESVACADCGKPTCEKHRAELGARVRCVACLTEYMAHRAELAGLVA